MPKYEHCDDCREDGILCSQPVDLAFGGLIMFEGDGILPVDCRFDNCPRKNLKKKKEEHKQPNQKFITTMLRRKFGTPNITESIN